MATCNDCSAIEPDKRGAAGHPHLVSLGEVRSMEAARKGARQELFVCARCDTEWEYTHDKRDETAGWRRVQRAGAHQGLMRA